MKTVTVENPNLSLSQWISGTGPEQDIVLSNRIRLARNLEQIPFPGQANQKQLAEVTSRVRDVIDTEEELQLHYIKLKDLPEVEQELLVEKNLTSPAHLKMETEAGLLLNDDENVCLMINEEDHVRIQVLTAGFQLDKTWEWATELDDIFEEHLDFAFSRKYGYLSACPTNLGTGLRASVMVHLPALNLTDNINKMLGAISKLGLVVRGIYGEGSNSAGNIYQISNQVTLGNQEQDIIDNLKSVTTQIIEMERDTRNRLLEEEKESVIDRIMRSYGILRYAHQISAREAMKLLSYVKLGIDMEIINSLDTKMLSELMILIRPAHLQKAQGQELTSDKRDIKRASLIRDRLETGN